MKKTTAKFEKGRTYVITIQYGGGISHNDPWKCTFVSDKAIKLKDHSGAVVTGTIRQAGTQQVAFIKPFCYQLYSNALYASYMID